MATPESKAKDKIKKALAELKADGAKMRYRFSAGSMYGSDDVDLILCFYGRYIGVEVKRFDGKGKLTKRQQVALDEIAAAGGDAYIIESAETLKQFVTDISILHDALKELPNERPD